MSSASRTGMDRPTLRDSVKHPEKMGPLGDSPDNPHKPAKPDGRDEIREQARVADREQLTTTE